MTNLAVYYTALGRLEEGLMLGEETLKLQKAVLGPKHPATLGTIKNLAAAATNWSWKLATADSRDPEKAVELARLAVELQPDSANNWNNFGVALYSAGQWQASIEAFEKAEGMMQGGDREHRMFLAMAHWQLDNEETASDFYAEGAAWIAANRSGNEQQKRFRAEAEQLLGLSEADRSELIADYYTTADIDVPQTLIDRGHWRQANGDHEEAIEDFTAALRLQPNSEDVRLWRSRGIAYHAVQEYKNAMSDLSKVLDLKPDDSWARTMRGRSYHGFGELDLALADLTQCIESGPSVHRYLHRAAIYRDREEFAAALADCEKAIAIAPEGDASLSGRAEAYALRGDIYADNLQQQGKAAEEYAKALELDPENSDIAAKRDQALQAIEQSGGAAPNAEEETPLAEPVAAAGK